MQSVGIIICWLTPYYDNAEVLKIIEEEAAPFFLGQKNVKSVAEIIQNRIQLYVNEHR